MRNFRILMLAFGVFLGFNACVDPDEHVTKDALSGGLLVPVAANVSYVLNNTPSVNIALQVPQGPAVQSIKVYKYYCLNCNDDDLKKESAEILVATLPVDGANVNETTVVTLPQTYQSLKEGIVIDGESLPDDESLLVIGDYWNYRFVSVMEDGRELVNNSTITVAVANLYSGEYHSVGTFIHPTGGPRDINRAKTLAPIDANTCETEFADLSGSGWKMWLRVNPDNTVQVIPIAPASPGTVPNGENFYDPATKSFTLNYKYAGTGGDRVISEVITRKE